MSQQTRVNIKAAKARRNLALARGELRTETTPRIFPTGVTSMAIKAEDPAHRQMVDDFLARRGSAQG